jgi:predicted lipid-binding transport protein (Tim44 family)
MKKALLFSLLAIFISVTGLSTTTEAKRFGGGMSFGKMFSKPKRFAKPVPKQGINKSPTRSGASAGGMMGILGGLAMGGLLGALFFGGGFEGINLFDMLLIGGVIFLIMRFMRGAAGARREAEYAGHPSHHNQTFGQTQPEQNNNESFQSEEITSSASKKPNIDAEYFVNAARNIFVRMQQDWDTKNEDDIRSFCTPEVVEYVLTDMKRVGNNKTRTEIGMLEAKIAETWMESGMEWGAVHFQAKLKEQTLNMLGAVVETENTDLNEIWIFQHTPNSDDPTWYLAGIQQA